MINFKELLNKIIEIFPRLSFDGGSTAALEYPKFDLLPHDYLNYAEHYISDTCTEGKINCVSNLKRALECQMDTFFHVMGINKVIKNKNLSFDQKLAFMSQIGIYKSRSLRTLNKIRNKIEHEYAIPDLPDIELYFELVYAFVSVIDAAMFMYAGSAYLEYSEIINNNNEDVNVSNDIHFNIEYKYNEPSINIHLFDSNVQRDESIKYSVTSENYQEFAQAFAVYFWIVRSTNLFDERYVCEELRKIERDL